ncbi:MAG TPA: type II toxin-antitoxin system prevent-host-death family antitoxin [Bryobacteraceae bacterium]|nr:type II toxin-antitoxin system prevent-host-death family antitoxin [Bryobacteraceae bacterium]
MTVNLGDARDKLSQLIQAVIDGEQVTITRHGEPVVDLVRTQAPEKDNVPKFGTMKGKIIIHDPVWQKPQTDEELEGWMRGEFR